MYLCGLPCAWGRKTGSLAMTEELGLEFTKSWMHVNGDVLSPIQYLF